MKEKLQAAIDELNYHDRLELKEKLADMTNPKWERLLRDLVSEIRGFQE